MQTVDCGKALSNQVVSMGEALKKTPENVKIKRLRRAYDSTDYRAGAQR
jgi:hypothetical protein